MKNPFRPKDTVAMPLAERLARLDAVIERHPYTVLYVDDLLDSSTTYPWLVNARDTDEAISIFEAEMPGCLPVWVWPGASARRARNEYRRAIWGPVAPANHTQETLT